MDFETDQPRSVGPKNPALPADLAEWHGAVRLTRFALDAVGAAEVPEPWFKASPEHRSFGLRGLLTTMAYALARGIYGSDELEERLREQPDLRYLCANNFPDSLTLRQFRRRHWTLLRDTLARLLAIGAGSVATDCWFDAEAEADLRLEQAAAADSLALDC
jgi:hypothetical protein